MVVEDWIEEGECVALPSHGHAAPRPALQPYSQHLIERHRAAHPPPAALANQPPSQRKPPQSSSPPSAKHDGPSRHTTAVTSSQSMPPPSARHTTAMQPMLLQPSARAGRAFRRSRCRLGVSIAHSLFGPSVRRLANAYALQLALNDWRLGIWAVSALSSEWRRRHEADAAAADRGALGSLAALAMGSCRQLRLAAAEREVGMALELDENATSARRDVLRRWVRVEEAHAPIRWDGASVEMVRRCAW